MAAIQLFLLVEAVAFVLAALVHGGVIAQGWEHREATIAEGVIAAVLLLGLVAGLAAAGSTRVAGWSPRGLRWPGRWSGSSPSSSASDR